IRVHVLTATGSIDDLDDLVADAAMSASGTAADQTVVVDLYTWTASPLGDAEELAESIRAVLDASALPQTVQRVVAVVGQVGSERMSSMRHHTFRRSPEGFREDDFLRGLHPLMAARLRLSQLRNFTIERLPAGDDVYVFHARARDNPDDERLFALAEVRDLTAVRDDAGRVVALPQLERVLLEALAGIRNFQAPRPPERRLQWNRVLLHVWQPFLLDHVEIQTIARRLAPATEGLGLERIEVRCRRPDHVDGELHDRVLRLSNPSGTGFVLTEAEPSTVPLRPLDEYTRKVVRARQRGTPYPYEIVDMVAAPLAGGRAEIAGGSFTEYDLEGDHLVPVVRPYGCNVAGIVVGIVRNVTDRYPEGMARVTLLGDPTRSLGSLAEPECRRINAALDLAEELGVPVDWFALSAGAKIAMDSGTESMDWIAATLRRIIEFTQRGGAINVVVTGINVGGQPYWNAEATMLMHTKGILVMTPDSAMVLTGKQALEYSGGVAADDNFGIGGYERIMGPNGQAQYWAPDLDGAIGILLAHHAHAYVAPGERFPRPASTTDPIDRDVCDHPHRLDGSPFTTVGDIFSDRTNPDRKLAFDIRTVMAAVADQDHEPLERWPAMRDADTVVVWDAHLGGHPVALLGIESRPLPRRGLVPADGPDGFSSGTLFPLSSKKLARAINSASGNRPVVVLANLSGFDGSPDSLRSLQLEYGAEIGRAVVNFRGPIVFCVISRFHGGAFVVFSQALNESLETIAVEGSRASVIGGAPAAAVVFAGEVNARARGDLRVTEL
ncbi:MAG TPA: carboxyl transferase domain-containing protein, partial [Ilumatobacteraceae bacterium]|nr:carboxyl transferase domain-containing protein [Ilumatobacteraceae bacterium]